MPAFLVGIFFFERKWGFLRHSIGKVVPKIQLICKKTDKMLV